MAKKELFDVPLFGELIKKTNAFPIKRGRQDVGAFRKVFKLLESGEALLVFPEGTRSKDGDFGKARPGLGMIACLSQTPAVPVRIMNSGRLTSFKPLRVIFGKPVTPPKEYTKETYTEFSERIGGVQARAMGVRFDNRTPLDDGSILAAAEGRELHRERWLHAAVADDHFDQRRA